MITELEAIKENISALFTELSNNKKTVQECYSKYMKQNKHTEMLDSLLFQCKLIEIEYSEVQSLHQIIENRLYGDYYKLLMSIYAYIKQKDIKYPVYKDLDIHKEYDFSNVKAIHEEITQLIQKFEDEIQSNRIDILNHKSKVDQGLNLDNYIHNIDHQNILLTDQVSLFKNHLDSYHKYHMSRYNRLKQKLMLMKYQYNPKLCLLCSNEAEYCKACAGLTLRNTVYVVNAETESILGDKFNLSPINEEGVDNVENTPTETLKEITESPKEELNETPVEEAEVPIETPTEEAAEVPIETPTEDTVETPVETQTEEPTESPIETQTEEPTESPIETPTEAPTEETAEVPIETPTESPIETPTEETVEPPVETQTEEPTEEAAEVPIETPTEAPTEETSEAPIETQTEEPTEVPIETPTEEPTESPIEAPPEETAEVPIEVPTEAPIDASTEEATEVPIEAPTEEAAETQTEETVEAPTDAPNEEVAEVPIETPTDAPNEEVAEVPTEETAEPSEESGSNPDYLEETNVSLTSVYASNEFSESCNKLLNDSSLTQQDRDALYAITLNPNLLRILKSIL